MRYGEYNLNERDFENIIIELIKELEKRGYKWKLFCNGMSGDYEFCMKILAALGLQQEVYLAPIPNTTKEFVELLCGFKAVIGGRMHAMISSWSLDIPIATYVWSNKLKFFCQDVGVKDIFLEKEDISANNLVAAIEKAISMQEQIKTNKEKLCYRCKATKDFLEEFLDVY